MILVCAGLGVMTTFNLLQAGLMDYGFNLSGTEFFASGFTIPGHPYVFDDSGFDYFNGLGTLKLTVTANTPGNYFINAYFDLDLADLGQNDFATPVGSPATGESWSIIPSLSAAGGAAPSNLDPVWISPFDNTNHDPGPDDVATEIGLLLPGLKLNQQVTVNYTFGATIPPGFSLEETDSSGDKTFLSATVTGLVTATPEPSEFIPLLAGMLAAIVFGIRRAAKTERETP
jgi:hypothetical protein